MYVACGGDGVSGSGGSGGDGAGGTVCVTGGCPGGRDSFKHWALADCLCVCQCTHLSRTYSHNWLLEKG